MVSREEWIRANVSAFAGLMDRIERPPPRAGGAARLGHRAGRTVTIANRAVTTRQFGYLLGFLGQRVLGQYDLALLSAEAAPGRLMLVDENIRRAAATLDVPLDPFRTWIVLHETTHAFEFEGHPWLRPYLAERFERQLDSMASGVLGNEPAGVAGTPAGSPRGGRRSEHWMEGLMSAEQRRDFREIQAVMSLLEGFSDYVMDRVGADLVPDVEPISERFHARRTQRTGFERAMMRVTGLDLKMEQYRQGEAFVAAGRRLRGPEACRLCGAARRRCRFRRRYGHPSCGSRGSCRSRVRHTHRAAGRQAPAAAAEWRSMGGDADQDGGSGSRTGRLAAGDRHQPRPDRPRCLRVDAAPDPGGRPGLAADPVSPDGVADESLAGRGGPAARLVAGGATPWIGSSAGRPSCAGSTPPRSASSRS